MPKLSMTETKDCFTRQVVKVQQSTMSDEIFSYHTVYLLALDGSYIGFCDMFNEDTEIQYPE